jgi:hypothetical protein
MLNYTQFFRSFVTRRPADVTVLKSLENLKELPADSVLHTLDHFNVNWTEVEDLSVVPSLDNVLVKLKPDRKQIYMHNNFNVRDTDIFEYGNTGVKLITIGNQNAFMKFHSEHVSNVRTLKLPTDIVTGSSVQSIINYNSLFRSKVLGLQSHVRLFDMIMKSVFNTINTLPEINHIIHIPLTSEIYEKNDFVKAFHEINRQSIKYPESSHYLILMHLFCFIKDKCTSSYFSNIPETLQSKINFIFTSGDKCAVYNLATIKELNGTGDVLLLKVINNVNSLATQVGQAVDGEEVDESSAAKAQPTKAVVPEHIITIKPSPSGNNVTAFSTPIPPEKAAEVVKEQMITNAAIANTKIDTHPTASAAQKDRARSIVDAYKSLKLNGKTIEEVLTTPVDSSISDGNLEFLADHVEDKSMLLSSVKGLSSDYMKKQFHKDLAGTLTSFTSQGMFLIDLKEEDKTDKFSKLIEYTATYEDVGGKRHTVKFTVPKVDRDGRCKINGAVKQLKIQRINNPIVKDKANRVLLSSNFNKTLVERNDAVAHNFESYIKKLLDTADQQKIESVHGNLEYNQPYAYEFTCLARSFKTLTIKGGGDKIITPIRIYWNFDLANNRYYNGLRETGSIERISKNETTLGLYFGYGSDSVNGRYEYYINTESVVSKLLADGQVVKTTIIDELCDALDLDPAPLREWVDFKVLNKKMPVIFALCYRYGLTEMLKYLDVKYDIVDRHDRTDVKLTDIVIRFADRKLIIHPSRKVISLLFSGLCFYDLTDVNMDDMDGRDVYLELIQIKRLSINYLKGVDTIFEMFIDPITADILAQMGEPTNFRDLLIRATTLLITEDHLEPSSAANFRFRSHERFNAIIYNTLARTLSTYQNGSIGAKKTFSVTPHQILQDIIADPLFESVDTINPIADIKDMCGFSHIGVGGRSSEAFVVSDRRFPKDAIGIISEATVDSGKVSIDAMLSMNPTIVNTRGLTTSKPIDQVSPTELLSSSSLFVPGADMDDGKRA